MGQSPRSRLRALARRRKNPIIILPYLGYGTPRRLTVCGRVLENEGVRPAADSNSRWRNLVSFYQRLESDEVPGARLRATYLGIRAEAKANAEGYFHLVIEPRGRIGPADWQDVELELLHPPSDAQATAKVLVPSASARFGVISDIDDTIVYSDVRRKLRMVLALALSNARTRKPFTGAAAFYRALHAGVNPVFYVSKSPWNLYVPLLDFLENQRFPVGPLVLRDYGLRMPKNHKAAAIGEILATYPGLKFILIGDSGESDPEIYAGIVERFPDRIRAIYIRAIRTDAARVAAIERLIEKVSKTGCQLVLAPDSEFAAAHAAAEGLIQASDLRAVRADKLLDNISSNVAASSGALK